MSTYLSNIAQKHFACHLFLEIHHERTLPVRLCKQYARRVHKYPSAFPRIDVEHLELLCGVRPLDSASLDLIELDRVFREVYFGKARVKTAEDDGFEKVIVGAVDIERWGGGRGGEGDEAEVGEGIDEVLAEGGYFTA